MREEFGELDEMARIFVMICESVVKPEAFDYAKWKGIGRPKTSRTAVFKAFLFKDLYDIPTTKELARQLRHDVQARRLCGWNSAGDVPSEGQFSVVNKEFVERGFAEMWFDDYVRTYVEGDPCATVSYDSAPISVRAKAENARRMLKELDPDQPVPPSRLEWQAETDAEREVFRDHGTDERFFSHLLDAHGGWHVRVRTQYT